MTLRAFVRSISPRLADCELTHLPRVALDVGRATRQHESYTQILRELGAEVTALQPLPAHADGVFVEDTAVIFPELAVVTRPGVVNRQGELDSTAEALASHRILKRIAAPGHLDGGDVLRIDRVVYVGLSARTDAVGCASLKSLIGPLGYEVRTVTVRGCLHLKTGVTFVPPNYVLLNPAWIEPRAFTGFNILTVAEGEDFAANTLTIGGATLVSAAYPRTEEKLCELGVRTRGIDISELQKAEAGLTCMTLILEGQLN